MKTLWTKIWITLATFFIALVTTVLILALHLAKAVYAFVSLFLGDKRRGSAGSQ